MKIILLSGGKGTRLWPLAQDSSPKQFLKILKSENCQSESMLQRVYRQLKNIDDNLEIVIVATKGQKVTIHEQIGKDTDIVIEPIQKGNFAATMLAMAYILTNKQYKENENIAIIPIDSYVEDDYFNSLLEMDKKLKDNQIGLIGIKPNKATEKYGYIMADRNKNNILHKVKRFIEKPAIAEAEKIIQNGGLWNAGVSVFPIKMIKQFLDKFIGEREYEKVLERYQDIVDGSIDNVILENCTNLVVKEYEGGWKDLGTWDDLLEIDIDENIQKGKIIQNNNKNMIINSLDLPLITIDVENLIVVATENGILISNKSSVSNLKNYIKDIK